MEMGVQMVLHAAADAVAATLARRRRSQHLADAVA